MCHISKATASRKLFPNEFSPQSVADCICYWSLSLNVLNFTTPRLNVGQHAIRINGYPRKWRKTAGDVLHQIEPQVRKLRLFGRQYKGHHAGNNSKKSQPPN
uniref:Uncharacterized protein n=1 Tax=Glossina austeni TaxID=7395 RepID=A0A1A9V5Q2_GLOAU